MRILNEQDQEITLKDTDLSLGYLKEERFFIESRPELKHYYVIRFNFDDGSSYTPIDETDSHIQVIDAAAGKFSYLPEEGETRSVKGMSIGLIIDQKAEDVYESILRYTLYTEEELIQRGLPERITSVEETLRETDLTIEDLILLMAEVLGGEEIFEDEDESSEDEDIISDNGENSNDENENIISDDETSLE